MYARTLGRATHDLVVTGESIQKYFAHSHDLEIAWQTVPGQR